MLWRCAILASFLLGVLLGQDQVIQREPVNLRSGAEREWRSFPERSPRSFDITFAARENASEHSLLLRQRDAKAMWTVTLNGSELGSLIQDERDMLRILPVPARALRNGDNRLQIVSKPASFSDDLEIRDVRLTPLSNADLQRQSTLVVTVTSNQGVMPLRVTVTDNVGSLVPLTPLRSGAAEAVRTGVVYTADGRTSVGVPAGDYRVYASRGFEYSAQSKRVRVASGQRAAVPLRIRREVKIPDYVSLDTHVHTLELSGHGDASVKERALTAAGEGLDLLVATEHNRLADYASTLRSLGLDSWVTSIPGSEVTTAIGHFNIFPVHANATLPNVKESDWSKLMAANKGTSGVRVAIQNHPRDIHSGYRPFDPKNQISAIGENRIGRPFESNAMEVVNSGAMASDPLQLVRDWMGLLTRGQSVAAIGASDTHTVDFVPIGQARTHINVSSIPNWRTDTDAVSRSLAAGQNIVSYGLAIDLNPVSIPKNGKTRVEVTVWGPSWSHANHIIIYSNGEQVWEQSVKPSGKSGQQYKASVELPLRAQDTALVAVVTGPGVLEPFWEVRKPYQPTSDDWTPIVFGVSRAIWIDGDGNGSRQSPLQYAQRLTERHKTDLAALAKELAKYDSSVTMHVLSLLRASGHDVHQSKTREAFLAAPPAVVSGYTNYTTAIGK